MLAEPPDLNPVQPTPRPFLVLSTHMAVVLLSIVQTDPYSLSVSSSLTWGLMKGSPPVRIKGIHNREVHKEVHV